MTLHNLSECRMPDCPVISGWFGADLVLNGLKRENVLE